MAAEAQLIFQGEVVDVVPGHSEPHAGVPSVPHTFVTYQIRVRLKGSSSEPDRITLRFVGGTRRDGRLLIVDHLPTFDLGDVDILFVRDNLAVECPLVDCRHGRFRVIRSRVFSEEGNEVQLLPSRDDVGLGAVHELREVRTWTVGTTELRRVAEPPRPPTPAPRLGPHLTDAGFRAVIQNLLLAAPHLTAGPVVVPSGRPGEPFRYPRPREVGPPGVGPFASPPTAADRREIEALERNGGNPVLPSAP